MERNAKETMNGRRSKDEIQGRLEATQEELRHTLEAIGESISPGEMIDTVLYALREGPGEFAVNLGRSVRDNPLAIGLVGAGLAWLMLGTSMKTTIRGRAGEASHRLRERAESQGQKLRDQAEKVRGKAGQLRDKVGDAATEAADEAQGGARSVADASKEKAEQARDTAQRRFQQARESMSGQPFVVAAIGLFAGAAAAALVPRSRTEERVFGAQAEHVVEMAEDAARGVGEGVREGLNVSAEHSGAAAVSSARDYGEPSSE